MSNMTLRVPYPFLPPANSTSFLKLSLGLDARKHEVSHLLSGFIDVMAHALRSQLLGHNVELKTVLVDHVCDTPTLVNDLAPSVAVEVFRRQLR
jgi:hypothetical protein